MQTSENALKFVAPNGMSMRVFNSNKKSGSVLAILVFGKYELEMLKIHLDHIASQSKKDSDIFVLSTISDDLESLRSLFVQFPQFNIILCARDSPDGFGCGGGFYLAQAYALHKGYDVFISADVDALPVGKNVILSLHNSLSRGKMIVFSRQHDNTNIYCAYNTKVFSQIGFVNPDLYYCGEDIEFRERIIKNFPLSHVGWIDDSVRHPFELSRPQEDIKEKAQPIKTQFFKRYLVFRNNYYTFAETFSPRIFKRLLIFILEALGRTFFFDKLFLLRLKWFWHTISDIVTLKFYKGFFSDESLTSKFLQNSQELYPSQKFISVDVLPVKPTTFLINSAHFTTLESDRIVQTLSPNTVFDYRKNILKNIGFQSFLLASKHASSLFFNPITLLKKDAYLYVPDNSEYFHYHSDSNPLIRVLKFTVSSLCILFVGLGLFIFLIILSIPHHFILSKKLVLKPKGAKNE